MPKLTDEQAKLIQEPNFAVVATVRPDGSPHTTAVWVDYDGEHVVFNTTTVRAKAQHLSEDPRVSVLVWDRGNPYRYVEVEGDAELDETDAGEHMNHMSRKYTGEDWADLSNRVIVRVRPKRVHPDGF